MTFYNSSFHVHCSKIDLIKNRETERIEIMSKKILVVDDEKPIADILQFNLKKEGYQVYCAYDGDDALKKVDEIQPDLMLLDIMLPNRDGMEVCREIRKRFNFP